MSYVGKEWMFMIAVLSGVTSLLTYLDKILKKKGLRVKFKVVRGMV
jgi:hypothetical protein